MKKLLFTQNSLSNHWVGDGFPVRTIFTYNDLAKDISPFLMMDYGGPVEFPPTKHIRGVGEHPHRGFETVTIVYDGEVEHRDSAGGGGRIGPGDVQWMTAASGLVHEEMHTPAFAQRGGRFEMIQLWVNLPAKDKMTRPRYQGITRQTIPEVTLPDGAGILRVIAGEYGASKGPAKTFTPIDMWDLRLSAGIPADFKMPAGHTCLVFVLSGQVQLAGGEILKEAQLGVLDPAGQDFRLTALEESKVMILGGEPIPEPIFGHGPFVMNSRQEIEQAFKDFQNGKMGVIGRIEGSES